MRLERPNVLLVVMDTARADAFEPYGAQPGSSPAVGQLANQGRAYRVFAPACWTVPSHAAMLSGLPYRSAGFGYPAATHADYKAAGSRILSRWLPAVLRNNGYWTVGVSTNQWVSEWAGFDRGFDEWVQVRGGRVLDGPPGSIKFRMRWALQGLRARADDGAAEVERLLRGWLGSRPTRPFFWFVNLVECHSPYLPPKPYNPLTGLSRALAADEALRYLNFDAIWKGLCSRTCAPTEALERMRLLYAGAIRLMDDWLARVLEALDTVGVLEDTIVVVTSDHGENLGETGLLGHGFSLDDRLLRVPLVIGGPARPFPTPVGSLTDVPAWLALSVGLQDNPWQLGSGRCAVAEFDAPTRLGDPRVEEALRAWRLGEEARRRLTTSFTCATNGHLKLLRGPEGEQLVDLSADPLETRPLPLGREAVSGYAVEIAALREALDTAAASEVPGVVAAREQLGTADEVAAMEEQMRLLGYL